MEPELSEDQAFFVDTTRRFLAAELPLTAVRALEHDPAGFDAGWWQRGAELGWTSMLVPEADGGGCLSEHGLLDLVLVAEELGRLVAPGPLVPVSVVAWAVGALGSATQRDEVLPGLLAGTDVAAWCGTGRVRATATPSGWVLDGTCSPVEAGAQAGWLLVGADTDDGPVQFLVPATDATITPLGGLDLVRRFASVSFDAVAVDASMQLPDATEQQLQLACALQCAETVGVISRVFDLTVEYLGDRYSFGRPLSSYQALKHRLADHKVWLEVCTATASEAARAVAAGAPDAGELVSVAKAAIGPNATELLQDCVQLHGGIGVTWEHDLHLYLRRATVNRMTYGTPDEHLERIAAGVLGAAS